MTPKSVSVFSLVRLRSGSKESAEERIVREAKVNNGQSIGVRAKWNFRNARSRMIQQRTPRLKLICVAAIECGTESAKSRMNRINARLAHRAIGFAPSMAASRSTRLNL